MTNAHNQRNSEIADFIENLEKNEGDVLNLDRAPYFNGFKRKDQDAILWIYQTKASQGELAALVDDKVAGVEEVARLYYSQKCGFQDYLTKEGFDVVSEVPKDYSGRIAILTHHGTLVLLGKCKEKGRHITMSRIHTPSFNYNHRRGSLASDLKLGESPHIDVMPCGGYRGSEARALATNPRGADGDELEESEATVFGIGMNTAFMLIKTRFIKVPEMIE